MVERGASSAIITVAASALPKSLRARGSPRGAKPERWISEGRVRVNAQVIASPAVTVTAEDIVAVDGQALPRRERTRLFLFHKPRGFLTSHGDPRGRPTIFDLLPKQLPRLISVGRLDLNTEGLLLLTNDGSLARVLELPSTGWLRRYRVRAHGRVTQQDLDSLRDGITIDGVRYGPIEATADRLQGTNVWMTFAIREGKNREVKNVLGHLGLAVNRLIRVSFGPFQLGDLPPGKIEEVRTRVLREQLGARIAALANADFSAPAAETAREHFRRGRIGRHGRAGPAIHVPVAKHEDVDARQRSRKRRACRRGQEAIKSQNETPRAAQESRGAKKRGVPPLPTTSASPSVHGARSGGGAATRSDADAHCGRATARARARRSEIPGDPAHG